MKVRQSTLGDADVCQRRMQYSLESPVYHAGATRAVGTAYHAGLEWAYSQEIRTGVWPDHRMASIEACEVFDRTANMEPSHESELTKVPGQFLWDDTFPDRATAHEKIEFMLKAFWEAEGAHWESPWNVLELERGFSLPLWGDEHTRNGSIDLIGVDPDGYVFAEDHKTSGKAWNYNKHHARKQNQAPFYVAALKELYPDAPGYRFFYGIMTYKGVFDRRESIVTDEHIAAVDMKAVQVVTLYQGLRNSGLDLPANPSSTLCSPKYCDHWDICPYGETLDLQH